MTGGLFDMIWDFSKRTILKLAFLIPAKEVAGTTCRALKIKVASPSQPLLKSIRGLCVDLQTPMKEQIFEELVDPL